MSHYFPIDIICHPRKSFCQCLWSWCTVSHECSARRMVLHTAIVTDIFCCLRSACSFPSRMSPACSNLCNSVPARLLLGIERKLLSFGLLYFTRNPLSKRLLSLFQDCVKEFMLDFSRICTSYLSHLSPYSMHLINVSIFMALLSIWKMHCWCMPEGCSEQPGVYLLDYLSWYTHTVTLHLIAFLLFKTTRPAWLD